MESGAPAASAPGSRSRQVFPLATLLSLSSFLFLLVLPYGLYSYQSGLEAGLMAKEVRGHSEACQEVAEASLRLTANHLVRFADHSDGGQAVGGLIIAMGGVGARALLDMKEKGAVTIVQDWVGSMVSGRTAKAVTLGASARMLPPEAIAALSDGLLFRNGRSTR